MSRRTDPEADLFKISSILPPLEPIKIIDVGAMSLGADPYAALVASARCQIVGFEPIKAELEKLRAGSRADHVYLPYFIGDGEKHTFYECNYPMTSSLFEPDTKLMLKFQHLEELTQVVSTSEVETRRLDDILEVEGADYLKLDTQGAELMILEGAERLLDGVVVVHTEVEFVPLYKNQPLFADVDTFLRSKGFAFHRLSSAAGRTFKPMMVNSDPAGVLSQGLWADAVYVKDFMRLAEQSTAKLLKLATILHENYRSCDLAALALAAIDGREGSQLQPTYLRQFQVVPQRF